MEEEKQLHSHTLNQRNDPQRGNIHESALWISSFPITPNHKPHFPTMIRLHTSGRGRYVHMWRTPLIKVKRCVSFSVFRTSETLRCVLPTSLGLEVSLRVSFPWMSLTCCTNHKQQFPDVRRCHWFASWLFLICFSKVWLWKPHRQSGVSTQALPPSSSSSLQ